MNFEIQTKDDNGGITFTGTANPAEASFLMEVAVNYLLGKGIEPILTGGISDTSTQVEAAETTQ